MRNRKRPLSRFGRNWIETGKYIEQLFPHIGVRFIAINDNVDSSVARTSNDNITIPFKNLINDAYCRDISIKTKSQLETKCRKGDFIGSFAVYGYMKDTQNHSKLVIDEFAACVVCDIYKWRIDGMSCQGIANRLNTMGVLSPYEYKRENGMRFSTAFKQGAKALWSAVAILRILKNEVYLGVLEQGKRTSKSYKIKERIDKAKEDWIRVENSHEPIISKEDFVLVNQLLKQDVRIAPTEETVYLFSGILKCVDCKQNMIRKLVPNGEKKYVYYVCATSKQNKSCSGHSISDTVLEQAVLQSIRHHIGNIATIERILQFIETLPLKQLDVQKLDKQIQAKKLELVRYQTRKTKLYEDLQDGIIDKDEYTHLKSNFIKLFNEAEQALFALNREIEDILNNRTDKHQWIDHFNQYQNIDNLSRAMVVKLIDTIFVYEGNKIDIQFKYQYHFDRAIRFIETVGELTDTPEYNLIRGRCSMARKSRKNIANALDIPVVKAPKVYNTAVYARLSVEDSGKKNDKGDSIENQVYLCEQFIKERPYLCLVNSFIDNGETGVNFDRPQFVAMMNDIKAGKIDCIVVKDLSRFGRNYIETGNFLEKVFPFLGVRFISVNDNYDTNNPDTNSDCLAIALKSLINDVYAKDISRKVTAALETKQKNGEFIGNFAPYGFMKSPDDKHKLVIDDEVAHVVRDIFKWKLEGMGNNVIARKLNDLEIISPYKYRYTKGIVRDKRYADTLWLNSTIKSILQNPTYTGCMSQGKKKTRLLQGLGPERLSSDNWVIVPDTHEPIIEKQIFDRVQEILNDRNKSYHELAGKYAHMGNPENIFKGLVVCADCKTKLMRYKNVHRSGKVYYSFLCPNYERNQKRACTSKKSISEVVLIDGVYNAIKAEIDLCANVENLIAKLQSNGKSKAKVKTVKEKITEVRKKIERIDGLLTSLYDDYSDSILTESEYLFAKAKYREEKRLYQCRLDELIAEETKHTETFVSDNKWIAAMARFKDEKQLTNEMMAEVVDRIEISENNKIVVTFKYRDEYESLINFITESGASVSA